VTVEAVVGTAYLADTASKGSRLVLSHGVVVGVVKVYEVASSRNSQTKAA
jgi:hypothetical protein